MLDDTSTLSSITSNTLSERIGNNGTQMEQSTADTTSRSTASNNGAQIMPNYDNNQPSTNQGSSKNEPTVNNSAAAIIPAPTDCKRKDIIPKIPRGSHFGNLHSRLIRILSILLSESEGGTVGTSIW